MKKYIISAVTIALIGITVLTVILSGFSEDKEGGEEILAEAQETMKFRSLEEMEELTRRAEALMETKEPEIVIRAFEITAVGTPIDPETGERADRFEFRGKNESETKEKDTVSGLEGDENPVPKDKGTDTQTMAYESNGDYQMESSDNTYREPGKVGKVNESQAEKEIYQETARTEYADIQTYETDTVGSSEGDWSSTATETVANKAEIPQGDSLKNVPEGDAASSIYDILKASLDEAGIGWWYPYACAQMMQESSGNPWAENVNGLDKGLFQYRISYWQEPEDIFDINAQIRRYTREVQARINAGLSIPEIISRHFTSDWITTINWEYVNAVLSRL